MTKMTGITGMTGMTGKTGVTKMTGITGMTRMTGMTGKTGVTKMARKTRMTGTKRITGMIRMKGMIGTLVFKPKCWANLFNYILFVLFFWFTSSSPCRKDQFAVSYFSTSSYCTDLGLQLGDPAPLVGLSLWTC